MDANMDTELEAAAIPIPTSFLCPITHHVMEDPVYTVDGHAYERAAIAEWFRLGNRTSPVTNLQLHSLVLTADPRLRRAIEEYMKMRPEHARREVDFKNAAAMAQRELLEKQGELVAQDGLRERLRSFARQLAEAEKLPEPAMRAVVRGVRDELTALGQPPNSGDAVRADREVPSAGPDRELAEGEESTASYEAPRWTEGMETCIATLQGHGHYVQALAVLDAGRLASASWDTTVKIWDVAAARCVATLEGHGDWVVALAVLDAGRLASGSDDVRLWIAPNATANNGA
jgi:hypothetical protein